MLTFFNAGREKALTKVVVQHLPEVMFPRMYIIRNSEKLQNGISSRVKKKLGDVLSINYRDY